MAQVTDKSCREAWYLIHCQPRKEKYACDALTSRLGLSIFLPEYKIRFGGEIRHKPFFPGYIFARADLQRVPLSQINATPGVIRLVTFGDEPLPTPPNVIATIYERLISFEQEHMRTFQTGDVVRVKQKGALQDLEMIFVGPSAASRRVTVLLTLLGRIKELHLDVEMLEKVSSSSAHLQERGLDGTRQKNMHTEARAG